MWGGTFNRLYNKTTFTNNPVKQFVRLRLNRLDITSCGDPSIHIIPNGFPLYGVTK